MLLKRYHPLLWVALFFLECEYLLRMPFHHEVRKALRALIGMPAHDILFAAIAFLVLAGMLLRERIPKFSPAPFSWRLLLVHLACTALLDRAMLPFHQFTSEHPAFRYLWWLLLGAYFLSWLILLVRPADWWLTAVTFGPWLAGALATGAFSVYLSKVTAHFWYALPKATMWCTEQWMKLFSVPIVRGPGTYDIGTEGFSVAVGAPCSGYEGMGLIACYILCFLWLRRGVLSFPGSLVLLPLGMVLSWIGNSLRIAILIQIGAHISPQLAVDGFHSQAGWLTFTIIGIGLVLLVEHLHWFRKDTASAKFPAAPYLLPLIALFFTQIASSAFTEEFDYYYPLRVLIVGMLLVHYRAFYKPLLGKARPQALLWGGLVYILWLLLAGSHDGVEPSQHLQGWMLSLWLLFRVLGTVLMVPLVEELAFRGYLLRRLQSKRFEEVPIGRLTLFSVLGSSLAFGVLHQDWLAGIVAGICYALVLRGRHSLSDAVVAHAVTNFLLAVHVLYLGDWGYW